ncbi:MAG: DUF4397 domain-containing protein [Chloroflexota bacterium]
MLRFVSVRRAPRAAHLLLIIGLMMLAACGGETAPEAPTRVPSPVPPTETPIQPTETATPAPTATPTIVPQVRAENPAQQAYARIIHAIPGAPAVDVYAESVGLVFGLSYGVVTNSTQAPTEPVTITVVPTGTRLDEAEPLVRQQITFPAGETSALVITGTADAPTLSQFLIFTDVIEPDQSRITLIHAAPDGPTVSLRSGADELTTPVDYNTMSVPVDIPAGPNTLEVRAGETTLLSVTDALRERVGYTYILAGNTATPEGLQLIAFDERLPGRTRLRVINISPDVLAADVYLNGESFATGLEYTRATERQEIPSGQYTLEVLPAGSAYEQTPALDTVQFNAAEGRSLTMIVMGGSADLDVVRVEDDLSPVPPGQVRMTFVHGLPDVGPLSILGGAGRLEGVNQIAYSQSTRPALIPATTSRFEWEAQTGDVVEVAENVSLSSGTAYLYLVTGRDPGAPPIIFSDAVTIDERLAAVQEANEPTPVPVLPARLRVINMIDDRSPVDVLIDGVVIAPSLPFRQVTPSTLVTEGVHSLSVRLPGATSTTNPDGEVEAFDPADLVVIAETFAQDREYVLYIYGYNTNALELALTANDVPRSAQDLTTLRLVNLTKQEGIRFDMAVRDSSVQVAQPSPDPTLAATLPQFREPYFGGADFVARDVTSGAASLPSQIRPGVYDLLILDSSNTLIAKTEFQYTLEAQQYDIVVIQLDGSLQVNQFILPYPPQ